MNVFRRALDILDDGNRWIRDDYEWKGHHCLVGALAAALDSEYRVVVDTSRFINARRTLFDIIQEQYGVNVDSIESWNDSHEWTDVERVLEKAAVKYDEKVDLTDGERL